MSFVQDIGDILTRFFKCWETVNDYEQGLFYRAGKAIEKRINYYGEKLEEIIEQEKMELMIWQKAERERKKLTREELKDYLKKDDEKRKERNEGIRKLKVTSRAELKKKLQQNGVERSSKDIDELIDEEREREVREEGKLSDEDIKDRINEENEKEWLEIESVHVYRRYLVPFTRPSLPPGYVRSFWTGLPIGPKRLKKDKVLRAGIYFRVPLLDEVIKRSAQEVPLDLGFVNIPITGNNGDLLPFTFSLSCNITYQVSNLEKAYKVVHDYEKSLGIITLGILASEAREKEVDNLTQRDVIKELEKKVLEEVKDEVGEDWGLRVTKVVITDNAPSYIFRTIGETKQKEDYRIVLSPDSFKME
jgi:hypothetical protein